MMNASKSWVRWRPFLGVLAVGVCAFSLTLQGAPPKGAATDAQSVPLGAVIGDSDATGLRPGGPLRLLPPSSADYRKVATIESTSAKGAVAIGTAASPNADGVASIVCTSNEQCSDCNPCTLDVCDAGTCIISPRPDGYLEFGCWDGFDCNGREECFGGACVTGIDAPDCLNACDEDSAIPGRPCTNNTSCDGGACAPVAGWVCDEVSDRCVDVSTTACTVDGDCDDGNVNTDGACETATGICRYSDNSTIGRCCEMDPPLDGQCKQKSLADCRDAGGEFLGVGLDACRFTGGTAEQPIRETCPVYAAGITPQGIFNGDVGPVSNLDCDGITEIGDDYETKDHFALGSDEAFMTIELMRFAGRVVSEYGARWVITFYDESGVKVEDVFWPDGQDDLYDDVFEIKTVDFDPPLVIPTKGTITWSVQRSFSPGGRVMLKATSPHDVGEQDVNSLWVNGAPVPNFLAGKDDTLAFELVGGLTTKPEGACCDNGTAFCSVELPWVCVANGDHYQGDGRLCKICQDGPNQFGDCTTDAQCENVCDDFSDNVGDPCSNDGDCNGGGCDQTGNYTCTNLPTCINQACCNAGGVDGACVEDATCAGIGIAQGFGTTCDPNCCAQTTMTGADDCLPDTEPGGQLVLHVLTVPPVGQPPVTVTITGNNSGATNDDQAICDVWGNPPPNGERGWWEGFSIDSCADVRIDLCCTDINGEPLRPGWGNLVTGCNPCGALLGNAGVPPPVGLGVGTTGFARGGPFCGEDNLWGTFGPLPAGSYFYPIYTVADGTSGVPPGATYQLHFTAQACRVAACCAGESCTEGTELDCDALGGYWLAPPNVETAVADCGTTPETNPCAFGSCCQGPGACVDVVLGGPLTKGDCDSLPGDYVGGGKCDDPTSPCPICTVRDASCYPFSGNFRKITDESWVNTLGRKPVHAEDFVAQGVEITQVCFEGDFFTSDGDLCLCTGTIETDCTPSVDLEGHITIELWSYDNFFPGTLLESSEVGVTTGEIHYQPTGVWGADGGFDWSLTLDTPLPTVDGTPYFLVTRWNTDVPTNNDCSFWQFDTEQDCANCNNYGFWNLTGIFNQANTDDADWSLCLDYEIVAPPSPTGACCEGCAATCTAGVSQTDCLAIEGAKWFMGEVCDDDTCPSVAPANDDCASAALVIDGDTRYTTICATSDGPTDNGICSSDEGVNSFIGKNIWYEYHTDTCDGTLEIGNCQIGNYDSLINVYKGQTDFFCDAASDNTDTPCTNDGQCPNGACEEVGTGALELLCNAASDNADSPCTDNSQCPNGACEEFVTGACPPCPTDNSDLTACSDDGCKIGGGGSYATISAKRNTCYLISVGGWALNPSEGDENTPGGVDTADVGFADLSITCGSSCLPPAALTLTDDGGLGGLNPVGTRGFGFVGGTPGELEAVRVFFASGPNTGMALWVQPPVLTGEASGGGGVDPNPANNFQWSELGCDPFYAQWNGYPDGVYVKSDQLTPDVHIFVEIVSEGACNADENNFSIPLEVLLSNWGDLLGCLLTDCTLPPDGNRDFADISGIVDKFKNLPGAIRKWRADVDPAVPNATIDFSDIPFVVDGFRGLPYPFDIPACECNCP